MTNSHSDSSSSDEAAVSELEDDFFHFRSPDSANSNAAKILSAYINSTSSSLDDLNTNSSAILKNIFLELNTALPASAACERLFSVAGRVFMPNRTRMTDEHFEQQLLLRLNGNLLL